MGSSFGSFTRLKLQNKDPRQKRFTWRLPQLLRKETSHDDAIPRFECNKLMVKDHIGQGAFGDVYTTSYRAPGEINIETVVIKKC